MPFEGFCVLCTEQRKDAFVADSRLLVPGTGGITLMDKNGKDLGYPARMRLGVLSGGLVGKSKDELVELLSMEHVPGQLAPAKTSLQIGMSIRPGHALKVAYNQVPKSFNHFLYDWRADLRYNASNLLDFLRDRKPPSGRWKIVAHSQGGLLVVLASKLLPNPTDFQQLVADVVLVGVPLMGTLNSARALLVGDQMGKAASTEFKAILRTWPSLYQMMPLWDAVVDKSGNVMPADKQLLSLSAWVGHTGVSNDLLVRATETQISLKKPLNSMAGVTVTALMAMNRKTGTNLVYDGRLKGSISKNEKGDTLVPYDKTIQLAGHGFGTHVRGFESPCNEHSMLFNDPAIIGEVKRLIP